MKKILSLFLALAMCVSMLPAQALAAEAAEDVLSEETIETRETPDPAEPAEAPIEAAAEGPAEEPPEETEQVQPVPAEQTPEYTLTISEEPEDTLLLEGMAFFYVSAGIYRGEILTEEIPAYQWQKWEEDAWMDLPEETDQVLVQGDLTEEAVGAAYRCRVTWEDLEVYSRSAAITGLAPEEEPGETGTVTFINPLYEDVLTEEDLPQLSQVDTYADEFPRYDSEEAFSAAIKQALLSREPSISGEVKVRDGYVPIAQNYMRALYFRAVDHTGVPTEGDYLRFEFGGYRGRFSFEEKTGLFRCTYNFLYYTTADQEQTLNGEVQRVLKELDLGGKSDKEKADAIYAYLCRNVSYDNKNLNDSTYTLKYTAYAALCDKTAVCQGYATAFYRLCLESGVEARVISSTAMNHAWNIVKLGRFYYCLDATWDANHPQSYLYYLKGSNDWLHDHKTANGVSTLGDEFEDEDFADGHPVPLENYGETENDYVLLEDGTLVLGDKYSEQIPDYREGTLNGVVTTAAPWREVAEKIRRIRFPDGENFRSIGQNAFRGLPNLEEVVIPETVESICSNAFRDCGKLTKLTILSGPETGAEVFTGCPIETLTVPGEWYAGPLQGCLANLKTLTLTDGGYMANYTKSSPAPWSGTGVETVTLDKRLQRVGNYAFVDCRSIANLDLPQNLRSIGTAAFAGCTGLKKLTFPQKLTNIGAAFTDCENLEELTFTEENQPTLNTKIFQGLTVKCIYPCTWKTTPAGNYGGTVTWQKNHAPVHVPETPISQTEDGTIEHWACSQCGRLYKEEACITELSPENVVLYREVYAITYLDVAEAENPNPGTYTPARGLKLEAPLRTGYLFGGWYGEDGKKVTSIAVGNHGDVVLQARWTAISYTLAFQANGGSGSVSRKSLTYDTDTVLPEGGFRRTGYRLSGWNTAKDGSGISCALGETVRNLTEQNKATLTLYAQWEPITYTLVLDPADDGVEPSTVDLRYGETYLLPMDGGSREGYHISAWTTQANGKGKSYTAGKSVTNLSSTDGARVPLYGRWMVNTYTVVFHSNDGADKQRKQSFTYGKTTALTGNGFSRTGYVFSGWSDTAEGESIYLNREKVTSLTAEQGGIVELYAVWKPISYQIAFKPNGASGEMGALTMEYGREGALPQLAYAHPGFTFLGWSTSASGKVLYADGATVKNLASTQGRTVTLYARWKAHSYEIRFYDRSGATGTTRAMTKLSCGKTYTLTANGFKKAGYDFVQWVDATGKTYANRLKGSNFLLEDGGVLELYAQWKPHAYTITYKNCIAYDENPNPASFTVEDTVVLEEPRRPGCEFLGWYLDAACKKPIAEISASSRASNLTLYAKWSNNGRGYEYTIAFNGNGAASGRMNPQTKRYNGILYTLPSNSFRWSGHTFLGWSLDPNAETPMWTNRAKVGNLAETQGKTVTLYAVWK